LVDEVAVDDGELRVLPEPDERAKPRDHLPRLLGLAIAVGQRPKPLEDLPLLPGCLGAATLHSPLALPRREVPDVGEDQRHERGRTLAPPRASDVDLSDATHAVAVEEPDDGISRLGATLDTRETIEEVVAP